MRTYLGTGQIKERMLIAPVAYDQARIGEDTVLGLRCPDAHLLQPYQPSRIWQMPKFLRPFSTHSLPWEMVVLAVVHGSRFTCAAAY
jgi:hypothetical protein